jgi:VanZ family protein
MKPQNHTTLTRGDEPLAAGRGGFLFRWRKAIGAICILMWMGAFTATHVPGNDIPDELVSLGKVALHGTGYLGLSSWFILALAAYRVRPLRRAAIVVGVMMLYGAFDEKTQPYFGRSCQLGDWITDSVAAAVAVVLWESGFLVAGAIARAKATKRREDARVVAARPRTEESATG